MQTEAMSHTSLARGRQYLRAFTAVKVFIYGGTGLNFLFLANRTTIVSYGGALASPLFWGIAFTLTGFLLLLSLIKPHWALAYLLSQLAVVGVTSAWIFIRIIIVFQTMHDFTAPLTWIGLLTASILRVMSGRDNGDSFDMDFLNRIDGFFTRLFARKGRA